MSILKILFRLVAGLLLITILVLVVWYQIDGIPTDATRQYLQGDNFTSAVNDDGSLIFTPENSNGFGIVIMHGALIKPQSYARSAAYFAGQGYTVFLPYGPGRMSIAASADAAERLDEFGLNGWFLIGHSMGGMASLAMVRDHGINPRGVALWATSMPDDFTALDIPILYIWGDTDGLLPAERYEWSRSNLPVDVQYITLEGANHKNFAMYSHQFFDDEATIDWMAQIDFANETTTEFFGSLQ